MRTRLNRLRRAPFAACGLAAWLGLGLAGVLQGPASASDRPHQLDLETLKRALEAKASKRPTPSSIDLSGYSFHWQLEPSPSLRVVAVSYNLRGDLLVFGADGQLSAQAKTGELTWLQLFDLDEDGTAELITEEVDGRGTGILIKRFRVYRLSSASVEPLWDGISTSRKALELDSQSGESRFEHISGYLRFEPSGGGHDKPRLLHLQEINESGAGLRTLRQAYELEGELLVPIPWNKPD